MAQPVTDAETDPIARQRPSPMPFHRYQPYHQQFPVDLPDRAVADPARSRPRPAGARSTCATATRP